jgi:hypothetical protein
MTQRVILLLWRSMPTDFITALQNGENREIGLLLKVYLTLGVATIGSASSHSFTRGRRPWPGRAIRSGMEL